jgi:hypothetical protein
MKRPLVLLPLLLLVSCGGQEVPSKESAHQVVAEYLSALSSGDWESVCQHLSPEAQEELQSQTDQKSCFGSYKALSSSVPEGLKRSLNEAKLAQVEIKGKRADVEISVDRGNFTIPLLAEEGVWRVHLFEEPPEKK